jgi:uncharacterized delta-60 repeat protein
MKSLLLLCLFVFISPSFLFSQAGSIDPTFGSGGLATLELGHGQTSAKATMADVAADGKILLAGNEFGQFLVARYWPDGNRDSTFGTGGIVLLPPSQNVIKIKALPDGKVLLLSLRGFQVARLNINGSVDQTFKTQVLAGDENLISLSTDIRVQTDGKILVSGWKNNTPFNGFTVVRYLANGILDTGFGQNGIASISSDSMTYNPNAMDMAPDGKILLSGTSGTNHFTVVRYLPDGTPDPGFGTNGLYVWDNPADTTVLLWGFSILAQPDGKILISASMQDSFTSQTVLLRVDVSGKTDSTFGVDGMVKAIQMDIPSDLAFQPDGKFILGGFSNESIKFQRFFSDGIPDNTYLGTMSFEGLSAGYGYLYGAMQFKIQTDGKLTVALPFFQITSVPISGYYAFHGFRLMENGAQDIGFGWDNKLRAYVNLGDDYASDVAIQADGKILVGGISNEYQFDYNTYLWTKVPVLYRFNENGSVDIPLSISGAIPGYSPDHAFDFSCVSTQPDGKTLVVVKYDNILTLIRFTATGSPDLSFGTNATVSLDNYFSFVGDVKVQADGKVLIGGYNHPFFRIIRLTSSGSIDPSFGLNGIAPSPNGFLPYNETNIGFALLPDGKMLLSSDAGGGESALLKYTPNGQLDTSFSGDGISFLPIASSKYMSVQTDGKIILGGTDSEETDGGDFQVMRVLANGSGLDPDFGVNGIFSMHFDNATAFCKSVAFQPDGKILCAGTATATQTSSKKDILLIRLKPNGIPDPDFGNNGIIDADFGFGRNETAAIALQPNGKIILAGSIKQLAGSRIGLVRFLSGLMVDAEVPSLPQKAHMAFPNPVSGTLHLDFSKLTGQVNELTVVDLQGRAIYQACPSNGEKMDVPEARNWQTGVYFLHVKTGNGQFVEKIIKL